MRHWIVTYRASRDPTVESRVVGAPTKEAAADEIRRRYNGRVGILSVHKLMEPGPRSGEISVTHWTRHRFFANANDPRPMAFPPPGPYWITGYGDDYSVIVAYLPSSWAVTDPALWPEATNIDSTQAPDGPQFSDRFPRPEWWTP